MMNMTVTEQKTVGELVKENPDTASIFEEFGIDYCCKGHLTLAEACEKKGVDESEVLRRIALIPAGDSDTLDCDAMTLTALADHIEETHHQYLRRQMPRLDQMAARVAKVHGQRDAHLAELHYILQVFAAELSSHMMKEERILFPLIRGMEAGEITAASHCGSVRSPIAVMEMEHENAGGALEKMRELTDGYRAPEHACNTYRVLYHELADLEQNLHRHVHKENEILFPKAIELERSVSA